MKRFLLLLLMTLFSGGSFVQSQEMVNREAAADVLAVAFDGVSRMPLNPHIKNRSRGQWLIVQTSLALGRVDLAAEYAADIHNWYQVRAWAEMAHYQAEQGREKEAVALLERVNRSVIQAETMVLTGQESADPVLDSLKDWRLQEVKARVFDVQLLLGQADENVPSGLLPAQRAGAVSKQVSAQGSAVEEQLSVLRKVADQDNFEIILGAIEGYVRLLERYQDEPALKKTILDDVDALMDRRVPIFSKIEVYARFSRLLLEQGDRGQSEHFFEKAQLEADRLVGVKTQVPFCTEVVRLHYDLGEQALAQKRFDELLQGYDEGEGRIVDMERAALLCRLAETAVHLERLETARVLYARAIQNGQRNPNGRPRAMDLVEIGCSLAKHEPAIDEALMQALIEMKNCLGSPW